MSRGLLSCLATVFAHSSPHGNLLGSGCAEGKIKVCTWLREISSCSCLTVLPGPAWVLLSKTYKPLVTPLYWDVNSRQWSKCISLRLFCQPQNKVLQRNAIKWNRSAPLRCTSLSHSVGVRVVRGCLGLVKHYKMQLVLLRANLSCVKLSCH